MSEKLRWVHDCTHNMGRKLIDDYQTRSLGHWFDACPHCAKPNPYHSKPTPPASHNAAYGPGSASSVEAAHMLMTGSMPEKVSLASHDAGEAVAEVYSHQSRDMCKVSTLHARFSRSVPVGTKLYPESAITTLTAEVSRLTGELAEAREQRDAAIADAERYRWLKRCAHVIEWYPMDEDGRRTHHRPKLDADIDRVMGVGREGAD